MKKDKDQLKDERAYKKYLHDEKKFADSINPGEKYET
jgi:hypothetical protein